MSDVQQLKTLIHESAHAKLHNILKEKSTELTPEEQKNNRTMEVEAESVAYTVDFSLRILCSLACAISCISVFNC